MLTSIYDLFIVKYSIIFTNEYYKVICYFAISALSVYKLHIGRTTNENIWDDIIKPYTWLCIHMKDGSSYLGQYRYGEPFKSEPIIVLATYQKLDKDNDVVIDNSQDMTRTIMINTKDFEKIEIIYTSVQSKNSLQKIWEWIKANILKR